MLSATSSRMMNTIIATSPSDRATRGRCNAAPLLITNQTDTDMKRNTTVTREEMREQIKVQMAKRGSRNTAAIKMRNEMLISDYNALAKSNVFDRMYQIVEVLAVKYAMNAGTINSVVYGNYHKVQPLAR